MSSEIRKLNILLPKLATLRLAELRSPLSSSAIDIRMAVESEAVHIVSQIANPSARRRILPAMIDTGSVPVLSACGPVDRPVDYPYDLWQNALLLDLSPEFLDLMFERGFSLQIGLPEIFFAAIKKPYLQDYVLSKIPSPDIDISGLFTHARWSGYSPDFEAACMRLAIKSHPDQAERLVAGYIASAFPTCFVFAMLAGAPLHQSTLDRFPGVLKKSKIEHLTSSHQRLAFEKTFGPLETFLQDTQRQLEAFDLFPE
jgi:hypothetical protein